MAKRKGDQIIYFVHTPGKATKYFKTNKAAAAYIKKRDKK